MEAMALRGRNGGGVSRRAGGWHVGRERRVRAAHSANTRCHREKRHVVPVRHGSTSRFSRRAAHLLQPCVASPVVSHLERLPGVERETKAELAAKNERFPVVHVHGGSAIRPPLMPLAVCALRPIAYLPPHFLTPTSPPT